MNIPPNFQTKRVFQVMTEHKDKVTIGLRLASMLVDHFVMTFIILIIAIPGFVFSLFSVLKVDHVPASTNIVNIIFPVLRSVL